MCRKIVYLLIATLIAPGTSHRIFADSGDSAEAEETSLETVVEPTADAEADDEDSATLIEANRIIPDPSNAIPTSTPIQPEVPNTTPSPMKPETPNPTPSLIKPETPKPSTKTITAYTGKVTKNKVRLRLQPTLDSIILRELKNGEMVVVTGENEEFYAIQPPTDIKGYIFRTFVLDNVVEGNHVNVRLEPDLSSPVIAQMNSGDRISGSPSNKDKKWIEMALPDSVRFYVAKEYVEKIGDAGYMSKYNKRLSEVTNLLTSAARNSQYELQKPFDQINLDSATKDLQKVISQYSDFPNETTKAKELLTTIQTAYLSKKVAYMESNAKNIAVAQPAAQAPSTERKPTLSISMAAWQPVEQIIYTEWAAQNGNAPMDEFYKQQDDGAVELKGIIEAYNKPIKNKPGDYLLLSPASRLPVAYLYSTKVDLQDKVGQEIVFRAVQRDNHNFAYPAYYVLSIE